MANADKPTGLTPVSYLNGADWDGRGNIYSILAADTNAFFVGDPVGPATGGATTNGIPAVTIMTPGTGPWLGVILAIGTVGAGGGGPYINPSDLSLISRSSGAKSVDYFALVSDDPNIIYEVQEDSVGGAIAVTSVWRNFNLIAAAPATGVVVSGYELDSSAVGDETTRDVKLLRLPQRYDNAVGVNAKWHVMFNNHVFRAGTAGV